MSVRKQRQRSWEIYMVVKDLELIKRLMSARIDPVTRQPAPLSARKLAVALGFRSHTYIQRILRGEVTSLDDTTATRIAYLLGVPVDLIFMPRVSANADVSARKEGAAA